ncbi:hypothetical protein FDECE_3405 [Fusarium decemcellulare]|nr:hypothetical protein FDECE_3405 [Fusarium decemcellulare]
MSSSLQTLARSVRATPARALGIRLTQTRCLSTTERDASINRDAAVRDPIMDKIWGVGVASHTSPITSTSTATSSTVTSTFTSRDPPLGTSAFDPSAAPRWSGPSVSQPQQ